ncbi:MAG: bile acid:sodium symporter [Bacteroidales bacterium]|nr:bile acid:sodium symporter [Bacteroidales bacterium]
MKTLQFLQQKLVWSIPVFMILGIVYGANFDAQVLKPLILPLTFVMVYPMMVNLNFKQLLAKGGMKVQIVTQVINFLIIPFLGLLLGKLFFADSPFIILGLLLTALLPTSGMTISWTGFAKGNMPAAVKMTIVGLILGSVLTPLYLQLFLGANINIPLGKVFQQIIIVVFLPMVFGYATQQFLIKKYGMAKYQKDLKAKFPPISTLGVLSIVFVAIALKAEVIISNPAVLLKYIVPLVIMYAVNFALSSIIGKYFFKRGDAIALVYGSVMRNLSIALAIAMTVFKENGSEIALIISLAYIIQVQAGAWYTKFTDKIFGAAPPDVARDIMRKGIFTISLSDTVQNAIDLLEHEHIHSLVVLDESNKPIGILNTRNLFDHVINSSNDITQEISSIELKPILIFSETTPIEAIAKKMKEQNTYKILVVDEKEVPSGVITEMMYLSNLINK